MHNIDVQIIPNHPEGDKKPCQKSKNHTQKSPSGQYTDHGKMVIKVYGHYGIKFWVKQYKLQFTRGGRIGNAQRAD